ncbi:MAG: 50S ribosomal protein L29 [Bacteroidota bacterium]
MKYQEISMLSPTALKEHIATQAANLRKLRFAHAISPIESPMSMQRTKKIIARLKTAQRAQQLQLERRKYTHAQK